MVSNALNSAVPARAEALRAEPSHTRASSLPARANDATTTRSGGSATQTMTTRPSPRASLSQEPPALFLHLRGANEPSTAETDAEAAARRTSSETRRGIRWADDVVDNEGLGRKSSKVCCIYHKPRGVNESSDDDDDDSDSKGAEASTRTGVM
ncbi:hypothetical protein DV737_g4259, partial [Chaetothyriales sp. CBS 132003]